MICKTEAIVLKSIKYSDTSKIITFYTKEFGKINCIAKGARNAKNKFGSALEPLSYSMLVIYKKEHKDLHLISQCDTIKIFKNITTNLECISVALAVIKTIYKTVKHEEKNVALFSLLLETLKTINKEKTNYDLLLTVFQIKLCSIFGYEPNFSNCKICNKSILELNISDFVMLDIENGSIICKNCFNRNNLNFNTFIKVSVINAKTIESYKTIELNKATELSSDTKFTEEIKKIIMQYLHHHFDGLKTNTDEYILKIK